MNGITLLSVLLIATPLLQWAYLSTLWHFTILEPPFTASRGVPLAMQVFFAPGNVVPVLLGAGLLLRSEWARRISRVAFVIGLAVAAWIVGLQVATGRMDSNILLVGLSAVLCGTCAWYFGRPEVRAQFALAAAPKARATVLPDEAPVAPSQELVIAACVECLLGVAAAFLLWHLHDVFGTRSLIDMGPGIGVTEADELLRKVLFAAFALFLAPHLLTTLASVGILLGRETARVARRYAMVALWTVVAMALVTAWLATREGLAFDAHSVRLIAAFCAASVIWHACFLYVLARHRPR